LSAAVCGCLVLAVLLLSIDDVSAAAAHDNLVVATLNDKLGNTWMPLVMLVVSVSIFACGVASMAAATRLVFSLARDNMLPFSPVLRGVHARWKTPVGAILLVWAVSTAVILGFRRLEIITSISATAGFLGYAGIVGASFRTRGCTDGFSLGRFRTPIRVASFVWALAVVAALTIPEADTSPGAIAHLPAKSAVGACAVGAAIYFFVIRARIARGQAGTPGAELRTLE
jgi:amino acid transporter